MSLATRPDHIPDALVYDFDFNKPTGHEDDVHLAWAQLHKPEVPDVFWTPRYGGHWVATRADDIDYMQANHEEFSMAHVTIPVSEEVPPLYPLEIDPPEHAKYRILLAPRFGPQQAKTMVEDVTNITNRLIDSFIDQRECEFVSQFSKQLPIEVFLKLVDLPMDDREELLSYAEMSVRPPSPEDRIKAAHLLMAYVTKWIKIRRENPGDDLFSLIVNAKVDGRPYNDQETYGMLNNVLFGGLDTVASMMGFTARFLAENPEHRRQLINNPELMQGAIEEFLRRFGIPQTSRVITQDMEYKGVALKKNEMILLSKTLHGLDERRYGKPLEVDFTRGAKDHAAFGAGPHRCVGMHLARQELRIFMECWLRRIPDFEIKPGKKPITGSGSTNGVIYLPLVW